MTRHPLDAVSLVFGLVFAAIGAATLVLTEVPVGWLDPRVALPVLALIAGLWLLVSATRRRSDAPGADTATERRADTPADAATADAPAETDPPPERSEEADAGAGTGSRPSG